MYAAGPTSFVMGAMALSAALAVGQAAGNARRREQARLAALRQWRQVDGGIIYVGTHGFYLRTAAGGLLPWSWHSVTMMEIIAPGHLLLAGDSAHGPIHWIISSPWAELTFLVWARIVHPRHPQLVGHAWLPPEWAVRVLAEGVSLPRWLTALDDE